MGNKGEGKEEAKTLRMTSTQGATGRAPKRTAWHNGDIRASTQCGMVAKEKKKNGKEPDRDQGSENAAGGWDRR